MDVARIRRRPFALRYVLSATGIALVMLLALWSVPALFERGAALPVVERSSLVVDTVRRGLLVRSVHASGQLAPDRIEIVATSADGIVDDVPVRAGSRVVAGSTIAVLANPDLTAAVVDARAQLEAANADLTSAREEASAAHLDQAAAYQTAAADSQRAGEEASAYASLHERGLVGDLQYRESLIKADEDRSLAGIAQRKVTVDAADAAAKVAAAQARVEQLQAQLAAREAQVAALVVTAGAPGIVQSVAVDRGQRIASGTQLAQIADERDLKAVLQVAEGDVHSVIPGMPVAIDTNGSGTLAGRVARIAPAAQNGFVPVDVTLDALPAGVRPDQTVDASIELSRERNVLSLERPANASDASTVALYKLSPDGTRASRTSVRLGTGSLERVEIVGGLAPGDTVIVSDTSSYAAPQLRIQ